MFNAPFFARLIACCALAAWAAPAALAQSIDLSLNLQYNDPQNLNSGGAWEVVAKSSDFGIQALSLRISNIQSLVQFDAPRGQVNGSDGAGFTILSNLPQTGHRNISISQNPINPANLAPGEEQGLFYGVGTIANGNPGDIGPAFTSLTNLQNVPWATGDVFGNAAWDSAAAFASGTFATGVTPTFFPGSSGQVFTSLGTSMNPGNIQLATISTIVRTNAASVLPDYNNNGVVDAADYVLWRKGVFPEADGNNSGGIDQGDYDLWRQFFGAVVPGAGGGAGLVTNAVPEPASSLLVVLGATMLLASRRRRAASQIGHRRSARGCPRGSSIT